MDEKEIEQNDNRTVNNDPPETGENCNQHPEEDYDAKAATVDPQSEAEYPVNTATDEEEITKSSEKTKDEISGDTEAILNSIADLRSLIDEKVEKGDKLRALNEKLYDDLKKYQDGIVDTFIEEIFIEIIRIIRDTEDQIARVPKECNEVNYNNLFKKFSAIPLRLKDMLYEHDVEPFNVKDIKFDPKRQEISSVVVTNNPDRRNTVKESIIEGWTRHLYEESGDSVDRIIRKEKVIAYKYEGGKENG